MESITENATRNNSPAGFSPNAANPNGPLRSSRNGHHSHDATGRDGIDLEALKRRLPTVDVVAADLYGTHFQRGKAQCCFPERHNHGDRDHSLRYDREKNRIFCASQNCFGEKGADAFRLVEEMEHCKFPQAKKKLASYYLQHNSNPTHTRDGHSKPSSGPRPADEEPKPKLASGVRATLLKAGYEFTKEYPHSDALRKVRLEHKTRIQEEKGLPEKTFLWEYLADGEWWSGKGLQEDPLYMNKLMLERDQLGLVVGFEGEEKADGVGELGVAAFSFKDISEENVEALDDLDVALWGDKDDAGANLVDKGVRIIAARGRVRSLRIVAPPDELPLAGDVLDGIRDFKWDRKTIEAILAGATDIPLECHQEDTQSDNAAENTPKIFTLAELRSMDIPEAPPIVEGLMREGETTAWVGKPKTGKSRLTQQLTICLSRGEPFLGKQVHGKYRVLVLDLENRPSGAKRRFTNMSDPDAEADERVFIYAPETLAENEVNVVTPGGVKKLKELVEKHQPDVVIIDTWRLLTLGRENGSDDVVPALRNLSEIRSSNKRIAIILVHHLRKQQGDNPAKLRIDPSAWIESCSGHHALVAHVDAAYGIEREVDKDSQEELIVFGGVARSTSPRTIILTEDTDKSLRFEAAEGEESLSKILTKKEAGFWARAQDLRAFGAKELINGDKNRKAAFSMLRKARQFGLVRQSEDKTYEVLELVETENE